MVLHPVVYKDLLIIGGSSECRAATSNVCTICTSFCCSSLYCEGCPSWVRSYLSHVVEGGAGGS
jgi:hypothetical protein